MFDLFLNVLNSAHLVYGVNVLCKRLKEEFPMWYEKPVLEMVHHNTLSLDKLVDQSWMEIMTKYAVDEECDVEVCDLHAPLNCIKPYSYMHDVLMEVERGKKIERLENFHTHLNFSVVSCYSMYFLGFM